MSQAPRPLLKLIPEPHRQLMTTGWLPRPEQPVSAHPAALLRAERRARMAQRFPGELLVIPTNSVKVRSNDTSYPHRPATDILWLVGATALDAVLVVEPDGTHTLFQPGPFDREGTEWFTDYHSEITDGPRPSPESVAAHLGIRTAPIEELTKLAGSAVRLRAGLAPEVEALFVHDDDADLELAQWLSEQRLIKDAWEIEQLQESVDITVAGFADVVRELQAAKGSSERYLEATFFRRARVDGNGVGYGSICAAGENACTLHYIRNDGAVRDGELLLLDMGVENREFYTADITRTLPISGRYTDRQREVYTLVYEAQEAALRVVRPGVPYSAPYDAAMLVLARGLERLGIVDSAEQVVAADDRRHARWSVHRISHMLGLDVHDCSAAREETYAEGTLAEGMVLTVEPGLYFRADDALVPEDLRGIGVRIEDDVVVTADGCRVLSAALPRHPDEVEAWMASLQA